ncbi:MAG: hypothetical protein JWN70_3375 [Planctomycetaceae bacterium]|nr:hypothetical protein [Planctomycetaceae bacterium]
MRFQDDPELPHSLASLIRCKSLSKQIGLAVLTLC